MAGRAEPVRVRFHDGRDERPRVCVVHGPLRLGYGKDCDLLLDGEKGPETVFELRRARGSLRLYMPSPPADLEDRVVVSLDGEPLREPSRELEPGARLEVTERPSGRRYTLVVEPPPFVLFRPRVLAAAVAVLAVLGAALGAHLYRSLTVARSDLAATEARLRSALEDLARLHAASTRDLKADFDARLAALAERARAERERVGARDAAARRRLEERHRAELESLREDFSSRLVEVYRRMKRAEEDTLAALGAGLASVEPPGPRLKRVFASVRPAVLYVRTRFVVTDARSGEASRHDVYGTGFLVDASGLALTSQHVLFPWRYDRDLLALVALGLVRVDTDAVRWSAWTAGERAPAGEGTAPSGYHRGAPVRGLELVYVPEPATAEQILATPLGAVSIRMPVPGATDVAVFRLREPGHPFPALRLADPIESEPLDPVLVVGYPFSRLDEGVAEPQAQRGFVRRVHALVELDLALHPGLSGSPVLDERGRVIGLAMAQLQSELYGLAIPAGDLRAVLERARTSAGARERRGHRPRPERAGPHRPGGRPDQSREGGPRPPFPPASRRQTAMATTSGRATMITLTSSMSAA